MHITSEGKIGILLALVGLLGSGAIMIAPEKLWIGWSLISFAALGGVALGFHHFGRGFAFLFVVAGVLWFDHWYYSNVLDLHATSEPQPGQAPPSSSPALPKLLSRMDRYIFASDVPPPDAEMAAKFPQQKEFSKQNLEVFGDAIGMSVAVTDIHGGIKIVIEANTPEARRLLLGSYTSKLTIEIRRVFQQEIVTMFVDLPEILRFLSFMAPEPSAAELIEVQRKIKKMIGAAEGKCQLM